MFTEWFYDDPFINTTINPTEFLPWLRQKVTHATMLTSKQKARWQRYLDNLETKMGHK
jgi:hypothetical protein